MKISAVIITFNEEANLERCLKSIAGLVQEIIVVDSYSTDKTKEIALQHGATFLEHTFEGHIQQKNYAIQQANNDLILSLDADESLSPQLKDSIKQMTEFREKDAFAMNRLTNYCGHWIRHCGWYPDKKIRLFNRRSAHWGGENPHDRIIVSDAVQVSHLKGDLLHYSFHSISQHLTQLDKFTSIAAAEFARKNTTQKALLKMLITPPFTFIKNYFFKLGFLDGIWGFIVCSFSAYNRFAKYAKAFALSKRADKS